MKACADWRSAPTAHGQRVMPSSDPWPNRARGGPTATTRPPRGSRCHELRIVDADAAWRIVYRVDEDAIVIVEVFSRKTTTTPRTVIDVCIRRLKEFDNA